jgi:4'-phosphopantetheinyl transferase EntD
MVLVLKEFRPAVCWDRLLFCAKEAVFKAVFSSTGRRLGFDEAAVTFDPVHEAFSVTGTPAGAIARTFDGLARPATISGSWLLGGSKITSDRVQSCPTRIRIEAFASVVMCLRRPFMVE